MSENETIECRTCGLTITAPTLEKARRMAQAGGWYDVQHKERKAQCRTCKLAAVRKAGAEWKPGDPTPF